MLGHDAPAILEELAQNEYDAGGDKMAVSFGPDALEISGNGRGIDSQGWRRLSVMLGTGWTSIVNKSIPQKTNSIGSKNFGLRSLFLFGDQIFIRSNGRQTVLDITRGSLPKPAPDPSSAGLKGVRISVPYRTSDSRSRKLRRFEREQEEAALESLKQQLSFILIKLVQPNSSKGLKEVVVTSERCDRQITWRQEAKAVGSSNRAATLLRRVCRAVDSRDGADSKFEELEWQKAVTPPEQHRGQEGVPGYFRVKDGRIRITLSLRVRRQRVDATQRGLFFYPLGIRQSSTGNAVNVCAPFQMDADRSQMIGSAWNTWLLEEAASYTIELLVSDWFLRFGAGAFYALKETTQPSTPQYLQTLKKLLQEKACWPTRGREKQRPKFTSLGEIVIPDHPEFDGFLSDDRYLDYELGERQDLGRWARELGGEVFSLNSLVRLRCAVNDHTQLATELDDTTKEADYHYTDPQSSLKDERRQKNFASAFDAFYSKLSKQHLQDLEESPTTLTASGELGQAKVLYRVDPQIAPVCPTPLSQRLHPALLLFKVLRKICPEFSVSKWVRDMTEKIKESSASEEERNALYQYVISNSESLARQTVKLLRDAPVLRDHRGDWTRPSLITRRKAKGANRLERVMHFPHASYARDIRFAEIFRFRDKVTGDDLVAYARSVQPGPEAETFEETLERLKHLLSPGTLAQLSEIAFLTSSKGGLAKPSSLYLHTALNDACLGDDAGFVPGTRLRLYKLLGCLDRPRAADIHGHLLALGRAGIAPDKPDVLYGELVQALKRENTPTLRYREEPILWVEGRYVCPKDVLVGARHRKIFLGALPQTARLSASLLQLYLALGAYSEPQDHHWLKLFQWFDERFTRARRALTSEERAALRRAYEQLSSLPVGTGDMTKFLLDRDGMLHSLAAVRAHRFVIDDAPATADALRLANAHMAFADTARERALRFYNAVGVARLTEIQEKVGSNIGPARPAPPWFNPSKIIDSLHRSELAPALSVLAARTLSREAHASMLNTSSIEGRLKSLKRVRFVERLEGVYKVADFTVSAPAEIFLEGDAIVARHAQSYNDIYDLLSQEIAGWFLENDADRRSFADTVFRLLLCNSASEMKSFFKRRGIVWHPQPEEGSETNDEPESDTIDTDDPGEQIRMMISESVLQSLDQPSPSSNADRTNTALKPAENTVQRADPRPKKLELPPLSRVTPTLITSSPAWAPPERVGGGKDGSLSITYTPTTRRDQTRDVELGNRGEEIVYEIEKERVRALGYPESRVVWTAHTDPNADYDILSVAEDGRDLWIEVKSTSGVDGRFYWSKAEFEKAARERDRYALYRVYEADTTTPSVKVFRDPISLITQHGMRLNVATLHVEAEPLKP